MRYFVRLRGQDEISGPFTLAELESHFKVGTLTTSHLALEATNQTAEQLKEYWNFEWVAISAVPGMECHTPAILKAPTNALTEEERRAVAKEDMLIGGLWFTLGAIVTAAGLLSYQAGGGFVIAWGATAYGAIQFFRGFLAR